MTKFMRVVACLIRPADLSGRIGGGLRRFVEIAARMPAFGIKFVVVESEPFLSSFDYFSKTAEMVRCSETIQFHFSGENALHRRLAGFVLFWLKILALVRVTAKTTKRTRARLILSPGESLAEIIVASFSSVLVSRLAVAVVQSDPFLELPPHRDLREGASVFSDLRRRFDPISAAIEMLTMSLQVYAMNRMALLVVGHALLDRLKARGIRTRQTFVVENGVDFALVEKTPPSPERADLIFVGRTEDKKGIRRLLKTLETYVERGGRLHIRVVAPGSEPASERARTEKGALHVSFAGALRDREVIAHLKASKVLVLPSSFESFSLVTGEALACGIPVLCFSSAGIREFFPTPAVIQVPLGDNHALIEKAVYLIENDAERAKLGEIGKTFVSRYDWHTVSSSEAQIILNLAHNGRDEYDSAST